MPVETLVEPEKVRELRKNLQRFLEIYLGSRILEPDPGALKMLVLQARNLNTKIKEKMINYKLGEVSHRLLEGNRLSLRDAIICEFLIDELNKYIASRLK